MKHPRPYKICQHDRKQKDCIESHQDVLCPTVPELKYKVNRNYVLNYVPSGRFMYYCTRTQVVGKQELCTKLRTIRTFYVLLYQNSSTR